VESAPHIHRNRQFHSTIPSFIFTSRTTSQTRKTNYCEPLGLAYVDQVSLRSDPQNCPTTMTGLHPAIGRPDPSKTHLTFDQQAYACHPFMFRNRCFPSSSNCIRCSTKRLSISFYAEHTATYTESRASGGLQYKHSTRG
jgi:hypothetical protein